MLKNVSLGIWNRKQILNLNTKIEGKLVNIFESIKSLSVIDLFSTTYKSMSHGS